MIDLSQVSACFITKDPVYPQQIIRHISEYPFGEILILTNSDSPFRKHELFAKAKYDWIYYSDDDAICPIEELVRQAEEGKITLAMKPTHYAAYQNMKMTMGLGWGAFFQKERLKVLDKYRAIWGEDGLFKRETERILTYLNFPQKRLVLPIIDLPSAMAQDRLSMQPGHYNNIPLVEQRCLLLTSK